MPFPALAGLDKEFFALAYRDHAKENFSFLTILHRRSHGCINRLWIGLGFAGPATTSRRDFDCLPHRGYLPFLLEQNVGLPVSAKRLHPTTFGVRRGRRCELDDHYRNRPLLFVELHH